MNPPPVFSVVFPAYNEEGRLEPTIREAADYFRARGVPFELIAVDDGSRDGTSLLVRRLAGEISELKLIRLPANRGKGYAVRAGVVNSAGRFVLFADADGSTPMSEIARLESALEQGAAVAIGSRAVAAAGVLVKAKWYRRVIGRTFHGLVRWLAVKDIQDTQCGFKLFRAEVAHDLFSRMRIDGFSFDVEVLLMAARRGFKVAEVPVNWTHRPGSRVNLAIDSLRMARDLFIIRTYAMSGAYDTPHVKPLTEMTAKTGELAAVPAGSGELT
ncbi:MAG: dolichyl-phosphate beta-glucosyltransferase [Gemmatimonadota bacterium]